MATALALAPTLTLSATPTLEALQVWWHARQADPTSATAFTDESPQELADLCQRILTGAFLFYLAQSGEGDVLGAMWLHDLLRDGVGTPRAGWLGTYVVPVARGVHTTQAMWGRMRTALTARGIQRVYIASHHANTRAHRVAEQHLGFHRVGVFPAFACFGGTPTACLILSMRQGDAGEAWALAAARAPRAGAVIQ